MKKDFSHRHCEEMRSIDVTISKISFYSKHEIATSLTLLAMTASAVFTGLLRLPLAGIAMTAIAVFVF